MSEQNNTTELTKEQKKAFRKATFLKILKIAGIATGAAAISGILGYTFGKEKGAKDAFNGPEMKVLKGVTAYNAINRYRNTLLEDALHGDIASEITDNESGEKTYLVYTAQKEAPDWWGDDKEDFTRFDLAEIISDEVANE